MSKKDKNPVMVDVPPYEFAVLVHCNQRFISMSDLFGFFTKLAESIDTTDGASPYSAMTVREVRDYLDKIGLKE